MGWETAHTKLVQQLRREGAAGERVLAALARVPRDMFVDEAQRHLAFEDTALSIGWGQTISQPTVVATMTEALDVGPAHRVLEAGTGSGYQAAVLAELAGVVITVERNPELVARSRRLLGYLGYRNVTVVDGDGTLGWPDGAPYDRIVVTAAPPTVPPALLDQLADGGQMVIPVGGRREQQLVVVSRDAGGRLSERPLGRVQFVPLIGAQGWLD
ncbi:MAG: protein-L-isoaspartate(D-aspartate) O-methyltransferase [Chloroflexi bacterium]|nr:protein-L-isoaspartate(D-aspartate) O-methyltransferase [Chloroflexota bacterium]